MQTRKELILRSEKERNIKEMRDKKLREVVMYLEMYSNCWEKVVTE